MPVRFLIIIINKKTFDIKPKIFLWGRIVEDVRMVIMRQTDYIYIPDLRPEVIGR